MKEKFIRELHELTTHVKIRPTINYKMVTFYNVEYIIGLYVIILYIKTHLTAGKGLIARSAAKIVYYTIRFNDYLKGYDIT